MTQLADFVVLNTDPITAGQGKWTSAPFESGGRLIKKVGGVEQDNAYITLTLSAPAGGPDIKVRIIVNDNPLPLLVEVKSNSQRTAVAAFPASYLNEEDPNVLKLHSRNEVGFFIFDTICHFRQNS
jgi:hypothetical protein